MEILDDNVLKEVTGGNGFTTITVERTGREIIVNQCLNMAGNKTQNVDAIKIQPSGGGC